MNINDVFNSENRFFSAMNKLWDVMVLNWLFILTVILGIGPASTGLYYAVAKNIRKSRGYTIKTFFHSFKINFKQGFVIGILQAIAAFSLYYCYWFAMSMAFFLSLRHLPSTLLMALILAAEVFLAAVFPPFYLVVFLIGCSGYAFLKSLLMEKILRKYTPKPAEGEENTVDTWYLE